MVVFLFNPFDAIALEATLGSILGRRRSGSTWLLYHTPVERAIVERDPRFNLIAEETCGVVYQALPSTSRSF